VGKKQGGRGSASAKDPFDHVECFGHVGERGRDGEKEIPRKKRGNNPSTTKREGDADRSGPRQNGGDTGEKRIAHLLSKIRTEKGVVVTIKRKIV